MPNNLDSIRISINFVSQQIIATTANIPPTIDAPTFTDPMGESFRVFELELSIKSSEKILHLDTFSQ
jgi:hypothetical protein